MFLLINIYALILTQSLISAKGTIGELDSKRQAGGFDYQNTDAWKDEYPSCGGNNQSPINLDFGKFREVVDPRKLEFHGYNNIPKKISIVNNGHSLELEGHWPYNKHPYISGGPLQSDYVFKQLHFHWGVNNNEGSEHTINGQSFPLEMHLVHYKKDYDSFKDALNHTDGISVVAVFFDIQDEGSEGIANVLKNATSLLRPNSHVNLEPFALSTFDGITSAPKYASYYGSLTTPPCSESVTWIIPVTVLDITAYQMKTFRCLNFNHKDYHNFRPTQNTNGRIIYLFKQPPS
ncbi:carbonic anhydrase 7-like isoform X1 [Microplitis mediator]|uniref:carbonic anhydrase 7-like isoform X1 n=1 Tax=Microplitis mediator TaxID=375433 RepID=UPI002556E712|nr:carbonic anhydrase 7-like isoform X1 [Microplitis mediator]